MAPETPYISADFKPDEMATLRAAARTWEDKPNVWAVQLVPAMCDKIEQLRRDLELARQQRDDLEQLQADLEQRESSVIHMRLELDRAIRYLMPVRRKVATLESQARDHLNDVVNANYASGGSDG